MTYDPAKVLGLNAYSLERMEELMEFDDGSEEVRGNGIRIVPD